MKYQGKEIKVGPNGGHYIVKDGKKRYVPHSFLGLPKVHEYSRDGRSDVSKYRHEDIPEYLFCGPEGGAVAGSYPVNTAKRCSAALSYARFAPNPCGIARCVKEKCSKYPHAGKSSSLMRDCNLNSFGNLNGGIGMRGSPTPFLRR